MMSKTRRDFLTKLLPAAMAGVSSTAWACSVDSMTKESSKKRIFDANGPFAKRLSFVSVAEKADHSSYNDGQSCETCRFFNVKQQDGDFARCAFAQNRYVPKCGWCKQYKEDPDKVKA